jgi:hypothetical protein
MIAASRDRPVASTASLAAKLRGVRDRTPPTSDLPRLATVITLSIGIKSAAVIHTSRTTL